jgi:hypothetical protein
LSAAFARFASIALVLCASAKTYAAPLRLADNGHTRYVIVVALSATDVERRAAADLQRVLRQATGAEFSIRSDGEVLPAERIVIATRASSDAEEFRIQASGSELRLTGSTPRATMFAVYRFLDRDVGCRWWAPDAESIPHRRTLDVAAQDLREGAAFRWRELYLASAMDHDWADRNLVSAGPRYAGPFVHTFYKLVPPELYFRTHPEWFSLISGGRRVAGTYASQLCLSNASLRQFVASRILEELRANPGAQIVSISQNDWGGFCQCDRCNLLYRKYGARSGALLEFVNAIARIVRPQFPSVLIDTLAYADTRKPPRNITAEPNVAIRFCCIECDRGAPLNSPRNASYLADFNAWRRIASHLHSWTYTANFEEYFLPHPNWFVLGSDLAFFQHERVESVFLEGVSKPSDGEMSDMRAWVLARLTWDPAADENALIDEFLNGYYGAAAAAPVRRYLDLFARVAASQQVTSTAAPAFLSFENLREAERLWMAAEDATPDPVLQRRIRRGHLAVRYAWLVHWNALRQDSRSRSASWPLPQSRRAVAEEWHRVFVDGQPQRGRAWLEEFPGYLTADVFLKRLSEEPAEKAFPPKHRRWPAIPMPAGMIIASAIIAATGIALRDQRTRRRTDNLFLAVPLGACLFATAVLHWRGELLTARYAAIVVASSVIALISSLLWLVTALRSKPAALRFTVAIASIAVAGYCVWWATPYGKARFLRKGPVSMRYARLSGANMSGVILQAADLRDADLRGAYLSQAVLNFAVLDGADLSNANLTHSRLVYTSFRGADLRGADFRGATVHDLTRTAFQGAICDESTRFPDGFTPSDWNLIRTP